jgi:putative transposase
MSLNLPKHSILVFDRGYTDYFWYNELNEQSIFFVTRMKRNANYKIIQPHDSNTTKGVIADQTIQFAGDKARECPIFLRRVVYQDPDLGKEYVFLTNNFKLSARTIADIYKERWQIELFFKWIKQNLKIKTFLGASHNAVLTQVWVAMCVYLILAYIKFTAKLKRSPQQILRLLHLNLFERRDLMDLLKCPKYPVTKKQNPMQLRLI